MDVRERIGELKRRRNAVILAHNYQLPEVHDAADFVGDSLELSRKAAGLDASTIVFCGVHFMAETAAVLAPGKTVHMPEIEAGCPMADMIIGREPRAWKARYPGLKVVSYVNTRAEVKTRLLALRESPLDHLIDVGTGAGFPGIPIRILYPKMQLTLVESVGKKAQFCRHVVNILDLQGVDVVQDRAENLGQNPSYREQYDWAVARAVAVLSVLAEYLLPLVRVGGRMLAMKGESGPAEAHSAERALGVLGGTCAN